MSAASPIKVLVVDDSAYIRKVVSKMLNDDPGIEVVGTARNGRDALQQVERLNPDVVTLDLIMPEMDGVAFLREQMKRRPLPVVVVSIASEEGVKAVEAMEAGALEFVQKPTALANEQVFEIAHDLTSKVKIAASVSIDRLPVQRAIAAEIRLPGAQYQGRFDAVVLGVSTGGPQALRHLLSQLPADFPIPLAIVLHMPIGYTAPFAQRLNALSPLEVLEAREGDEMRPGRVLLAPAGKHLLLKRRADGTVAAHLDIRPTDTLHRPSVDVLFHSAAEVYGSRVVGVVLTGMGNDGTAGAAWIKAQGGYIISEDPSTCVVYGMPRAVFEAGLSDHVVPLHDLARTLLEII